ncbi:hypothetical protein EM595_0881 [Duffyella gerundensis]|uniref:Uncharacterized protein n=1 Tax=Duffyella gerundensis TaxID=1619313 RepID=A0A0U5E7I9_9GAMM|nr:hypothetical protein EM595_0881 [Duffyella gerundensis]
MQGALSTGAKISRPGWFLMIIILIISRNLFPLHIF